MSRKAKALKREYREAIADWYIVMDDAKYRAKNKFGWNARKNMEDANQDISSARKSIENLKKSIVALRRGTEKTDAEYSCEGVFGF